MSGSHDEVAPSAAIEHDARAERQRAPRKASGRRQRGVSIRDVARLAGSHRALPRASSPARPIRSSTRARQRVEEAAGLSSSPTPPPVPSSPPQRDSRAIMHDITDPFFSVVVRGCQDAAVADGLVVLVGNDGATPASSRPTLAMLRSQSSDGRGAHRRAAARPRRHPAGGAGGAAAARAGSAGGGRGPLRARHPSRRGRRRGRGRVRRLDLVELGHRHIAFLGGPLNSTTVQPLHRLSPPSRVSARPLDERLVIQTPLTLEGGSRRSLASRHRRRALHGHLRGHRRGRLRRDLGLTPSRAVMPADVSWWARRRRHVGPLPIRRSPRSGFRPGPRPLGVAPAQSQREQCRPPQRARAVRARRAQLDRAAQRPVSSGSSRAPGDAGVPAPPQSPFLSDRPPVSTTESESDHGSAKLIGKGPPRAVSVRPRPPWATSQMYVDGEWVRRARDKGLLKIVDSGQRRVVARVANGGVEDAEAAVLAARRAFDEGPWPRTPARERPPSCTPPPLWCASTSTRSPAGRVSRSASCRRRAGRHQPRRRPARLRRRARRAPPGRAADTSPGPRARDRRRRRRRALELAAGAGLVQVRLGPRGRQHRHRRAGQQHSPVHPYEPAHFMPFLSILPSKNCVSPQGAVTPGFSAVSWV